MSVWSTIAQAGAKLVADNKNGILKGARNFLGSYFSSFKQGGFKCLGKQAFTQEDLQNTYKVLDSHIAIYPHTPDGVAGLLTYLSTSIAQWNTNLQVWKSPCSKQNGQAYIQTMQELFAKIDKSSFSKTTKSGVVNNIPYNYDEYKYKGGDVPFIGYIEPKGLNEKLNNEDFKVELSGSLLDDYGNIDPSLYTPGFIAPEDLADRLTTNASPTWSVGAGGKTADGVDWNIGAGKTNQDNTTKYLVLGLMGLLAYKLLFDRK